jgi:hypothetical protein
LASGHYDWLGVRADGRFVLGRPWLAAIRERGRPSTPRDGTVDAHRVEYTHPLRTVPDQDWFVTGHTTRLT